MTALATVAPGLPPLSPDLSQALADAKRNASYAGPALPLMVNDRMRQDAERRIGLLQAMLNPAGPQRVQAWVVKLATLKKFSPSDIEGAASLMARFLSDLPDFSFTMRTLESAAATFKAWPDYAELKEHLAAISRPIRDEITALRLVQDAPDPVQVQGEDRPDPAKVRAQVEALKAEMKARRDAEDSRRGKILLQPRRLKDSELSAIYEQQIAEGRDRFGCAATRLALLRKQVGA